MHKELIERLKNVRCLTPAMGVDVMAACEAIEALQATATEYQQAADKMAWDHKVERDILRQQLDGTNIVKWEVRYKQVLDQNNALKTERDELRQKLADVQRDSERYRWLRDNSASISWNPSRYNSEIVSGFSYSGTGYLGFNFEDAIKEVMKGTKNEPRTNT